MNASTLSAFLPVIECARYDSPIDALVALCVPQDEAMNLVAASWQGEAPSCVMATVDGGRPVVVLRTTDGRWAACNAFPDKSSTTRKGAEHELQKLLKRGRRGHVVEMPVGGRPVAK